MLKKEALQILRATHRYYKRVCAGRFADRPFRSVAAPGWIYFPKEDRAHRLHPHQKIDRKVIDSAVMA